MTFLKPDKGEIFDEVLAVFLLCVIITWHTVILLRGDEGSWDQIRPLSIPFLVCALGKRDWIGLGIMEWIGKDGEGGHSRCSENMIPE